MIDYNWDNEEGLQLFMWQKYKNENLKCNGSPAKVLYNVEGRSDLNGRVTFAKASINKRSNKSYSLPRTSL